jgi:fumarylacetoacetate (FAA) hydrolase
MKLATYKDGSRDGQLVVVSRDLCLAHYATGVATRLQQVLDDWNFLAPLLQDLSETLNHGKARHAFAFDPQMCMAPLPRAPGRSLAQAYPAHAEVLARAAGRPAPPRGALPVRLRPSDALLGPTDDVFFPVGAGAGSCAGGGGGVWPDFGAGLAVITGDVEAGVSPDQALDGVRLLTLVNDWRLLPAADAAEPGTAGDQATDAAGLGGWAACAPVAVTLDELGPAWQRGRLAARLEVAVNDQPWGPLDTAAGMAFHFGQLIAQLARQRPLRAGFVVGAGPISQADGGGCASWIERRARRLCPAAPSAGAAVGEAEAPARKGRGARSKAAVEAPPPAEPFPPLQEGDRVHLELFGLDGMSLCGAIDQAWVPV